MHTLRSCLCEDMQLPKRK